MAPHPPTPRSQGGQPPPRCAAQIAQALKLLQAQKLDQAEAVLRRVIAAEPSSPLAHRTMCNVLLLRQSRDRAAYHGRLALRLAPPGDADFLFVLGRLMREASTGEEAAAIFQAAVTIDPSHASAWIGWCDALLHCMRFCGAAAAAREGLVRHPGNSELVAVLGLALENLGQADDAVPMLAEALAKDPASLPVAATLALGSNYAFKTTPEASAEAHRAFGRLLARTRPARAAAPPRDPRAGIDRPLRIAFVSPDLRMHAVASFFEPLLTHLDRARFQIFCYSTTTEPDAVTARFRPLAHKFVDCPLITDHGLEDLIRNDKPDIFIDLCGLMAGQRLSVLHAKPAPVTAHYLGYPNTTGLVSVNARFVDSLTDPATAEPLCVEPLVRLDPCFVCFQPPRSDEDPGLGESPGDDAPVTFGCFNMHKKLSDDLLRIWLGVLRSVPGSRLILKNFALRSQEVQQDLGDRLTRLGFAPESVEINPPTETRIEHLRAYQRVDIALDTFPYCGTTTTCEALFMGVPVVSLVGDAHRSRVGLSVLSAVGRGEWCTANAKAYAATITGLARDIRTVRANRSRLRTDVLGSVLCDGPVFAGRFGAALESLWRKGS